MSKIKKFKILTAFFKYDYGIKERGYSLEYNKFYPAIAQIVSDVYPFWIEENGYPENIKQIQKSLIEHTDNVKPDIIFFVLMSNEITIDTIKYLSKKSITINWFADDQWRFNSFTALLAPVLTFSVTVDKYSLIKYEEIGCKNVILSQWAASSYAAQNKVLKKEYLYDISFVGQKNEIREWIISELESSGLKIECFGHGWPNGKVSFESMEEIFLKSKINLNLSNSFSYDIRYIKFLIKNIKNSSSSNSIKQIVKKFIYPYRILKLIYHFLFGAITEEKIIEQIKARNFEIPAAGGFQITNYVLGIEDYYQIGKEIAVYNNIDDLKLLINYFLSNDKEREKIKYQGHLKSADYTYDKLIQKVLNKIKI